MIVGRDSKKSLKSSLPCHIPVTLAVEYANGHQEHSNFSLMIGVIIKVMFG